MILPFSTKLNGKPTFFVEKIISGLALNHLIEFETANIILNTPNKFFDRTIIHSKKIHTIREDKKDRWKPGTMIDFFINTRTKDMFRFAPRIPVVDVQEVFMTYFCNDIIEISVDGTYINNITEFAINDGFDSWNDFFNYFYPIIQSNKDKCFKGKIIHWTDNRY